MLDNRRIGDSNPSPPPKEKRDLVERGRRARRREGEGGIAGASSGESLPLRHIITAWTFKPRKDEKKEEER
jgi:hypothetical protein